MLKISPQLQLSLNAVTQTYAILAMRGVGKTHTASVMAEEMLRAGQPIVAYDPTGAWWGLKSSADGKRPGYPVVIFGGEHADVPLEESAGETIAATIVEKRIPAVLDVSLLRKAARVRFMTDFCETLYFKNRQPLHLFIDEAHTVAPHPPRPEGMKLLGAVEDIILQGRRKGLGLTIISQRPAIVNASVRSQCATLIAMRITSPLDRKAIQEWTESHGTPEEAKEMMATLSVLPKGDAWVWNPSDGIFTRVHFRERQTFDSSATPEVGGKVITPQRMAEVDIRALGAAIQATVEKAKADDPRELRRRIAALEQDLTKAGKKTETKVQRVEVPALNAKAVVVLEKLDASLKAATGVLTEARERWKVATTEAHSAALRAQDSRVLPQPAPVPPRTPQPKVVGSNAGGNLTKAERLILTVLAQYQDRRLTDVQVAVMTGYAHSGGGFRNALSSLRTRQCLRGGGEQLEITEAGLAELGPYEPLPRGAELQQHWMGRLSKAEKAALSVLIGAYPRAMTPHSVAQLANYDAAGGGFRNALSRLRTLMLISGRGELVASDELFD